MRIKIDNEIYNIDKVYDSGFLPIIETEEGPEFYLASDTEHAGQANRESWQDMIDNDPKEFECIVGVENLIKWALGQSAGPGSVAVSSLEDWLALTEEHPEEQWASYDGNECEVDRVGTLVNELDFTPTVAYRHN